MVFLSRNLTGEVAPESWQGGLNFTYRIGPGFNDASHWVKMHVHMRTVHADMYNAVGIIEGSVEPGEEITFSKVQENVDIQYS